MKRLSFVLVVLVSACGDSGTHVEEGVQPIDLGIGLFTLDTVSLNSAISVQFLGTLDLSGFDSISLSFVATDLSEQPDEASIVLAWFATENRYDYEKLIQDTLSAVPRTHSVTVNGSEPHVNYPVWFYVGLASGKVLLSEISMRGWAR